MREEDGRWKMLVVKAIQLRVIVFAVLGIAVEYQREDFRRKSPNGRKHVFDEG